MKNQRCSKKLFPAIKSNDPQCSTFSALIGISLALLISTIIIWSAGSTTSIAQSKSDAQIQPEALGSVSGRVADEAGNPIEDVTVELFARKYESDGFFGQYPTSQLVKTATTNSLGQYAFGGLTTNIYTIQASAPSMMLLDANWQGPALDQSTQSATSIPISGGNVTLSDIVMPKGGKISGQLSMKDELAFSFYTIAIYPQQAENGLRSSNLERFDANAVSYETEALPEGTYRVCASAYADGDFGAYSVATECYDDHILGIESAKNISVTTNSITPNIDFRLGESAQYAKLSGTLTGPDGEPAANVLVSTSPVIDPYPAPIAQELRKSTTTDSLGRYLLDQLRPYEYFLTFYTGDSPYITQDYGSTTEEPEPTQIELEVGTVLVNMDAQLTIGGQISGRVLHQSGQPPTNSSVWAAPVNESSLRPQRATVDPVTGEYTLRGLAVGTYELVARALGYDETPRFGQLTGELPEEVKPISVTLDSRIEGIDITLNEEQYDGVIQGTVSDEDGRPLANIRVRLQIFQEETIFYTETNEAGRYTINGLDAGSYYLYFSDPGEIYSPQYHDGVRSYQDATPTGLSYGEVVENIDAQMVRIADPPPLLQIDDDVRGVGDEATLAPALYFPIVMD